MNQLFDETSEKMVIATMIEELEARDLGLSILTSDCFFVPLHQVLFSSIASKQAQAEPMTFAIFIEEATQDHKVDVMMLQQHTFTSSGISPIMAKLRDLSAARRIIESASRIVQNDTGTKDEQMEELFENARAVHTALESREAARFHTSTAASATKELIDDLKAGFGSNLNTGYSALDSLIGGFYGGEVVIIAGRTGEGKTALALNIVRNVVKCGYGVLYFSLEMLRHELMGRLYANEGNMHGKRLRAKDGLALELVERCAPEVSQWPLYIDDRFQVTMSQLRARARSMQKKHKLSMIVIDHVGLIKGSSKYRNRKDEMDEISREIKFMAKELNLPIYAIVQLNRQSCADGVEPDIFHLKDSGNLEQDADFVMLLFRDKAKEEDGYRKPYILKVAKSRAAATGPINFSYESSFLRFIESQQ